jgi:beta-N-acetylhexosaminidase
MRVLVPLVCAATLLTGAACGQPTLPSSGSSVTQGPSAPPRSAASTALSTAVPTGPATTGRPRTPSRPPSAPATSATPTQSACERFTATLSLEEQVGQLFMVGVSSSGLPDRDARVIAEGRVGSVILLGNSRSGKAATGRLTERVRAAADEPGRVQTMLTVDQEGGQVQRLRGPGFDRMPSARRQAGMSEDELATEAASWGRQLEEAGVDANLAPVADVVPRDLESVNQPIGALDRGYGPEVDVVAGHVTAFVRGMDEAGIATAVKHFPGLGRVRGNTDYVTRVVDRSTERGDRDLEGFRAGVRSGVDMVMVSSAFYSKIDADHRAAFSRVVIEEMLREDLEFEGVVISDDLAARALSDVPADQRARRFLQAGGDLTIVGNPRLALGMIATVVSEARSDADFARDVRAKATRVVTMKAARGLADCG